MEGENWNIETAHAEKSSKFKVGDKVYFYLLGKFGEVTSTSAPTFPLRAVFPIDGEMAFTADGKHEIHHKNPGLFTLDEALDKGFIDREIYDEHRPKKKRILKQCLVLYKGRYSASAWFYETLEEARKQHESFYCVIKLLDHTAVEVEE